MAGATRFLGTGSDSAKWKRGGAKKEKKKAHRGGEGKKANSWKPLSKTQQRKLKRDKHYSDMMRRDRKSIEKNAPRPDPQTAPPGVFISQTASPNVYIASCAAEEMGLEPRTLYAGCGSLDGGWNIPPRFRDNYYEYIPPAALGHVSPDPEWAIPEVTFIGKSNVGKSSLINALTGRGDLARISKRPGRTQQPNYFALVKKDKFQRTGSGSGGRGRASFRPSDSTAFLVDLPGYGYAYASEESIDAWQGRTQDFLMERHEAGVLSRVYLLVDGRHGSSDFDRSVMAWLDEGNLPYSIVLTKSDRTDRPTLARWSNDVCMRYHSQIYGDDVDGFQGPVVHITSAEERKGIAELLWSIDGDFEAIGERNGQLSGTRWGKGKGGGGQEEEGYEERLEDLEEIDKH